MQIHCHTKGRSAPSGGGDIFISPSGPSMRQSGPFCPFFLSHFLLWSHLTFFCFLWQEHVSYSPKVFIGKSSVKQNYQTLSYKCNLGEGCSDLRISCKKIPSKLEVAPPPKCGLGEWVIPLRLLRLLEHLAVLKNENFKIPKRWYTRPCRTDCMTETG